MKTFNNLTGIQFGRLKVMEVSHIIHRKRYWKCRCKCGNETTVISTSLVCGNTKSCGCLHKEITGNAHRTHGMRHTPEYSTWCRMRNRCYRKTDNSYGRYGARGIIVCESWRDSFQNFFNDMGRRPSQSHSIDRIENNGPYSPENCKWSTKYEQASNKRSNIHVTLGSKSKTVAMWAREFNINQFTVYQRIRRGWTPTEALTRPVRKWSKDR